MKIAVLSDIHGNLEALKTTLIDIEKRKIDKIFCLGDIVAKGKHPSECIKLLKEKCEVMIQGNCDEYFSRENEIEEFSMLEQNRIKYQDKLLSKEEKEFLAKLPFSYEFYLSGSLIRIFHATPFENNGLVLNISTINEKYEMFMPSEYTTSNNIADIVIYGHIHHQYMDKLYNKTLINAGSVGNAFDTIRNKDKDSSVLETTNIHYLILEGKYESEKYGDDLSINFVRIPYDIEKELSNKDLNFEKEDYENELKKGNYRNATKINEDFIKRGIKL